MKSKWSYSPETPNLGQNRRFFVLCDLDIWRMTLKNNKVPLPCYFMICVSLHSHLWNQNEVTVRKHQIWVKIEDFLSCVILIFDGWPWKTIGHLFYATSSFLHHFIAIRSKSQCGSNILSTHIPFVSSQSVIQFLSYNSFKIWPWKSRVKG